MKKSTILLCSIFLIAFVLNGCAQSRASSSSTIKTSSADLSATQSSKAASSAVQSSENLNITLEKDQIFKDLVFRETSAADGKVVLARDQIQKIEMQPSRTVPSQTLGIKVYDITFYLTDEGCKQFASASREMAAAEKEMSIWGKDGKVASGEITEPITDGIFVLNGSFSLEEARQRMDQLSSAS